MKKLSKKIKSELQGILKWMEKNKIITITLDVDRLKNCGVLKISRARLIMEERK